MKLLLSFFAIMVLAVTPAHASENRITVSELHNFVTQTASAINNPNLSMQQIFFGRAATAEATFSTKTMHMGTAYAYANPWHHVWYNQPYYGAYYRYPLNHHYNRVSSGVLEKQGFIAMMDGKKRRVPGYHAQIDITDTMINPYGAAAIVDIDMKEYGLHYNPYDPTLAGRVMHANSKCKMYLSRLGAHELRLTRMDCNTNSNLPF